MVNIYQSLTSHLSLRKRLSSEVHRWTTIVDLILWLTELPYLHFVKTNKPVKEKWWWGHPLLLFENTPYPECQKVSHLLKNWEQLLSQSNNEKSRNKWVKKSIPSGGNDHLSRGVLPETLRRGPYAVVDKRCEDTTLDPSSKKPLKWYQTWTLVSTK